MLSKLTANYRQATVQDVTKRKSTLRREDVRTTPTNMWVADQLHVPAALLLKKGSVCGRMINIRKRTFYAAE
jgi:hypothetical protein